MNRVNVLIEEIWQCDPAEDVLKAFELANVLFNLGEINDDKENRAQNDEILAKLTNLEKNVHRGVGLYNAYFLYKSHEPDKTISYKFPSGKIEKFMIYDLWMAFYKLYYGILEIILNSNIFDTHGIKLSGKTVYDDEPEGD